LSDYTASAGELNGLASSNEVRPSNKRKRYTAAYKLRILEEADRCVAPGELAALIRREGIYSSTLADFRKQKARGELDGGTRADGTRADGTRADGTRADGTRADGTRSSRKLTSGHEAELERRLAAAERENRKLRRELERSRIVIDLQKKVSELLGVSLESEE
jgi:transposase-like protein